MVAISCDEDHPCLNCLRRGMDCTFEHRSSATPPRVNEDFGILSDIRGRMLDSSDAPCPRTLSEDPFRTFSDRLSGGTLFPQEWTAQDPELMHHYTIHTSKTFARRPQMQETWQVVIPEIAYSYEFLMHGILGLSALHLSYLKPERYSHYLAGAGFHMSLGLRSYRRILLSPSRDNSCALFCFSSLLMVYIHASPTDPPESHSANGLDSIVELLGLCRGTLVLLPYFDRIRTSPLKQLFLREFMVEDANETTNQTTFFKDYGSHLAALQTLITSKIPNATERPTFLQALDRLKASFTCIENASPPLECGMLYVWPLSVEEQYFEFLRQRHPVALVLLAFYCAQLRAFEDYWFVGRQGAVWLEHVEAVLEGRLNEWLLWPRGVFSD
ncbi:uncharacterized protein TRUGW13939_05162 [Talaromyces rugulosus]|uniref:Zn(2)-C6 fungal-type domain-containing protein n=1 Tax=Talaromyces rugulosus TaxID=121627 RepID=A0A7H8QVF7_TALRU|nr:uncharacterized protein TRUGW13939_05162 [Talaromyces rugulosus]QKX58042.1 hypothetical protein TRUGW13939_05162 [Talaromyces rugulosus]